MNPDSYKILLLGDFHYGESYKGAGASMLAEHGYSYSTRHLLPFIEASDHFVVNLETPLLDGHARDSPLQGKKKYIHWAHPSDTPQALRSLGVNAVALANNHVGDHGAYGLESTLESLARYNIAYFGAGMSFDRARKPYRVHLPVEMGGGSVNLHSTFEYSERHDREYEFYARADQPGCAPLNTKDIAVPESETQDNFDIAFPHWGRNYQWRSVTQRSLANRLLNAGYDLVLGHGSHCIQEVRRSKRRWIVYSIGNGNFQSGGRYEKYETQNGILPFSFWAMLDIRRINSRERRVYLRLYPVRSNNRVTLHQPGPVNGSEFSHIVDSLLSASNPSWMFENPAMQTAEDELGHCIVLDLGSWPVAKKPSSLPPVPAELIDTAEEFDVDGRRYNDIGTRELLDHYERGRNLGALLNAQAARARGATIDWVSPSTAIAYFDSKRLLINGYKCDESDLGARVVQDKFAIKHFLERAGVATARGDLASSPEEAIEIARRLGGPVVVKPRAGNKGRGITVNIASAEEIRDAFVRAQRVGTGVLVEESIPAAVEYRCLATDTECVSVVRRVLPNVIGDGRSTIGNLIVQKNLRRRRNPALYKRYIPLDEVTAAYLARSKLGFESVLPLGEKRTVRDVGGLSSGGEPIDATADVDDEVRDTASSAVGAIPGLNWGGVDLVVTKDGAPYIIEINSDADISGAMYPVRGEPRNAAGYMIDRRIARADTVEMDEPARVREASGEVLSVAFPGVFASRESARLSHLLFAYLEAQGFELDSVGSSLRSAVSPDGRVRWYTSEALGVHDSSAARRVVRRHGVIRQILASSGLPCVPGRRVRSRKGLREFFLEQQSPVTTLPTNSEWHGARTRLLAEEQDCDAVSVSSASPWFAQRTGRGTRYRIFATRSSPVVVSAIPGLRPSRQDLDNAGSLAVLAVRAIPGLQHAAVDILFDSAEDALFIEGLSADGSFEGSSVVYGGSFRSAFEFLLRDAPLLNGGVE